MAERHSGGEAHCVAQFLGALWDDPLHFPFRDLRVVDNAIRASMVVFFNYVAVGAFDVEDINPEGAERIRLAIVSFDILGC